MISATNVETFAAMTKESRRRAESNPEVTHAVNPTARTTDTAVMATAARSTSRRLSTCANLLNMGELRTAAALGGRTLPAQSKRPVSAIFEITGRVDKSLDRWFPNGNDVWTARPESQRQQTYKHKWRKRALRHGASSP